MTYTATFTTYTGYVKFVSRRKKCPHKGLLSAKSFSPSDAALSSNADQFRAIVRYHTFPHSLPCVVRATFARTAANATYMDVPGTAPTFIQFTSVETAVGGVPEHA